MNFIRGKSKKRGFTFIEIMVTLIILTSGITMIFKSFLISLDRINYLTTRMYASVQIDNRISEIQKMLRAYKVLPFELDKNILLILEGRRLILIKELILSK